MDVLGKLALTRHAKQKRHTDKVESLISSSNQNNQPSSSSSNISTPSAPTSGREITSDDNSTITEQICSAEALWSSVVAEHDIAFLTNDHASKIFHKMFPDSPIAAGFKCGRTKTNY